MVPGVIPVVMARVPNRSEITLGGPPIKVARRRYVQMEVRIELALTKYLLPLNSRVVTPAIMNEP